MSSKSTWSSAGAVDLLLYPSAAAACLHRHREFTGSDGLDHAEGRPFLLLPLSTREPHPAVIDTFSYPECSEHR